FYRQPTAPDIRLRLEELDLEAIQRARIFWTTGTGLSDEPSRTATLGALEARARGGITIHDLDFRRSLWPDPDSAGPYQRCALKLATVAIGNPQEVAVAVGDVPPEIAARRLLNLGPELAIVKLGEKGVVVAWDREIVQVDPVAVEVVNGLGAGDAFGGAVCHGLLAGWDPAHVVRFAAAAGALVAGRLACADAMPAEHEVLQLMASAKRPLVERSS
ncbi:MAG TPA: PfkB family carbohydrate kinase, partial [Gemmatimonadales bacterium]|nr:PfkB family carbohydrate kinase [Gemmatimonadales bacterium]